MIFVWSRLPYISDTYKMYPIAWVYGEGKHYRKLVSRSYYFISKRNIFVTKIKLLKFKYWVYLREYSAEYFQTFIFVFSLQKYSFSFETGKHRGQLEAATSIRENIGSKILGPTFIDTLWIYVGIQRSALTSIYQKKYRLTPKYELQLEKK